MALFFALSRAITPSELEAMLPSEQFVFVNFYCPSCPASIRALEEWQKIVDAYSSNPRFLFLTVDCERYRSGCVKMEAEGYPYWCMYSPYYKERIRYGRDRTFEQFQKWLKQMTGYSEEI